MRPGNTLPPASSFCTQGRSLTPNPQATGPDNKKQITTCVDKRGITVSEETSALSSVGLFVIHHQSDGTCHVWVEVKWPFSLRRFKNKKGAWTGF